MEINSHDPNEIFFWHLATWAEESYRKPQLWQLGCVYHGQNVWYHGQNVWYQGQNCGIMVEIQNRYFWIQVTSITVQDVTPCCTVSSTKHEPGPWRWRHLNSSELLASWHSITTHKTCICRSITESTGFTLIHTEIHTEIHGNKHVTTVLAMLWHCTCQWLCYSLVNVQMIARFQRQNKPTGIQTR
jgi:hypothetical protein